MRAYKFLDEKFGIKSLQEKRLKISALDDLNDPFELLPYEMTDRNKRSALNATRKQIASNRGYCASVPRGRTRFYGPTMLTSTEACASRSTCRTRHASRSIMRNGD
jgi:hypothetical protein